LLYPGSTPTPTPTPTATPSPTPTPTPTPTPIQVTVQTNPAGFSFTVDGTSYSAAQTFSWTPGSSHTIATTSPQSDGTGGDSVRYAWANWSDSKGISHTVTPSKNTTYTAKFNKQYYLTMSAGVGGSVVPAGGWKNSGTTISISATPTSNTLKSYNFSGWTGVGTGSYSGANNPASITIVVPLPRVPLSLRIRFRSPCKQTRLGGRFRLMALPTLPRKAFRGSPVQVTRFRQHLHKTVIPTFGTSG